MKDKSTNNVCVERKAEECYFMKKTSWFYETQKYEKYFSKLSHS